MLVIFNVTKYSLVEVLLENVFVISFMYDFQNIINNVKTSFKEDQIRCYLYF